ncbi:MAG: hypothetical protein R3C28_06720 [Pirellulaceae bacterium]
MRRCAANCVFDNCKAFADDNSTGINSALDYYFLLSWCDHCKITNCFAKRVNSLAHNGHGFVIRGLNRNDEDSFSNTIEDCDAEDLRDVVLLRGRNVRNNVIKSVSSVVSTDGNKASLGCVKFVDGAHHNSFDGLSFFNSDVAISIMGNLQTMENLPKPPPVDGKRADEVESAADNNTFFDCDFIACAIAIDFNDGTDENINLQDDIDDLANSTITAHKARRAALIDFQNELNDPNSGIDWQPDLSDGSKKKVFNNFFYACMFTGDPNETSYFIRAARTAYNNSLVNCDIEDFDHYVYAKQFDAGTNKPTHGGTPSLNAGNYANHNYAPIVSFVPNPIFGEWKVDGLDAISCNFWNVQQGLPVWYYTNNGGNTFNQP